MSTQDDPGARVDAAAVQSGDLRLLPFRAEQALVADLGMTAQELQLLALERGVLPGRYQRSFGTVGLQGQRRLLQATALVVGAGGLGGYVVEGLARMGVGHIVVVDGDVFEEHNLNRQLLCTEDRLGAGKAEAAAARAGQINCAVRVTPIAEMLTEDNADRIVAGADVVVDALDSLPVRFTLEKAARLAGIPLVHGAIAGYIAQVMTIFPEDDGLALVYGRGNRPERGIEVLYGNPAATPMLCAACQVQEAIKVLVGVGEPLRNRLLLIDGEFGSAEVIRLC
ncbi:MAG: HesA/MoeB/ThiF family protein [Chloroflexota bacterium]